MNWLVIAILAQIIIGSSAIFDKLLLKHRTVEPWGYTFWFGLLGLFSLLLLPFGFQAAPPSVILLAFFGGILFVAAAFFLFRALKVIEVSETLPLIGVLSPIATLILLSLILGTAIGFADYIGFLFLMLAGVVLVLAERRNLKSGAIPSIFSAAVLLAASNVVSKIVFSHTSFITGFFWIKIGSVGAVLVMLMIPSARKRIRFSAHETPMRRRWLYFANRGYAAIGSLLIAFSISLANPALVDSTQNIRYLVIFLLAGLVLKERFRGRDLTAKIIAAVAIAAGLTSLATGEWLRSTSPTPGRPITWGVTFSQKFSEQLGIDWRAAFQGIIDELHPGRLRLIAYWDRIEPEEGRFQFNDLDWQIARAKNAGIPVLLAMGMKLPRWPECHIPAWVASRGDAARNGALNQYIARVLEHYKDQRGIMAWQVENEPFLKFGECPVRTEAEVRSEVSLVHSLDASRPVVVTDSGELGRWYQAERIGDVFGTTMYRKIYPWLLGPLVGVIQYPLPPDFFRLKSLLIHSFSPTPAKRFIVVELQAEPWEPKSFPSYNSQELVRAFSPAYFQETIAYAQATGFDEYYLWGVEWWWWMKQKFGVPDYWNTAKLLFASSHE